MKDLIEQLKWRYAVKKFDSTKILSETQVEKLKHALSLTASSMGLQPYKIMVISDQATKELLLPLSYNQAQITTASHLFLFCAIESIDEAYADQFIQLTAATRQLELEALGGLSSMIKGFVTNYTNEQKQAWAAKQTYIALGNLLTVCALDEIDACPMEGFDANRFAQLLDLEEKGLKPLVLCATGYRSQEDDYQHYKKVRKQDLFDL
jgi:nitroreductase